MNRFLLLFLLLSFSLLFSTCHKDSTPLFRCKESNTIKLPQITLDYFYFKVGSWWVYQCEQTGEFDSIYISHNEISNDKDANVKRDCNCGWGKCFNFARVYFKSHQSDSLNKLGFIDYLIFYSDWDIENNKLILELREGYRINNVYSGYKFTLKQENNYNIESTIGGDVRILDTITLNNILYKDVLKYSFPGSSNTPDWSIEAYYGKNLHLLQYKNSSDAKIWNLIKYHIEQ